MIKNTISKIIKLFKSDNNNEIVSSIQNKDFLYIELSNSYISYELNNNNKIQIVNLEIQKYSNFEELLKVWIEAVDVIVQTINLKVDISIIIKSNDFIIKNSEKFIDEKVQNKYFASKLALDEDNIEVKYLYDKSYMIVEYKFLQKILFAFKKYKIVDIYDLSILNSLNLKEKSNHLYLDISFNSCDIILNYNKIQKRDIHIQLSEMIDTAAKNMYIDFNSAYESLQINFKNIKTYDELVETKKPMQKELLEYIDIVVENINNSLSYFSILENIEYVDNIYINGDILELDFIVDILSDKLNINFISLNIYQKVNYREKINLLFLKKTSDSILEKLHINFDGLNYNDGRDEYIFIENKFIEKGTLSGTQKAQTSTKKKKREVQLKSSNRSFFYDENEIPVWKMSMTELFEFIKDRVNYASSNDMQLVSNKKIFYAFGIVPVFITCIYFFNIISDSQREFNSNIEILENRVQRVDVLKKQLVNKNKQVNVMELNKNTDKIFWTQKLITIANLMPNEIWLSSLSLENIAAKIEDKEVTKQTMVLESRALPSAIGHISSIALYMNKLLNAEDDFKKDFSSINFGGASIQNEYGYDVVNFKLLCEFEKNINIKDILEKEQKVKDKSIGENLMNINKNKKMQKQMLDQL